MNIESKLNEAIHHMSSGNFELGFSSLKELILMYPYNHNVNYLLGFAYRQVNQLELSEIYIKKSIEIDSNIGPYHVALGVTQQKQMKYDDAIISFESAIKINPNNIDAFNSLGYTYRLKDKLEKAREIYSKALMILFNIIYDNVVKNSNWLIPFLAVEKLLGDHEWMQLFMKLVVSRAAKEGMENISFPTGETALEIENEETYGNKLFIDEGKSRLILPNFIHNFVYELNSNIHYSNLINNVATVYAIQERIDLARKFYLESILFTPKGQDFQPPIVGLQNIEQQ